MTESNQKESTRPIDIIGDVHGCFDELAEMLDKLGYAIDMTKGDDPAAYPEGRWSLRHPEGRLPVFLGDLCDRGPYTPKCFSLVADAWDAGDALCVCGNHEGQLLRRLTGKPTMFMYGLDETVEELGSLPPEFSARMIKFMADLPIHYVFGEERLVVVHAGIIEARMGISPLFIDDFCVYGNSTGKNLKYGLPERYLWAQDYRGEAMVVYGHIPVPEPQFLGRTLCIDTGCVYGGSLTAYRYPEGELVSVPAGKKYAERGNYIS